MSMSTQILRIACAANGLSSSGNATVMLQRLIKADNKESAHAVKKPKKCKSGICKPKPKKTSTCKGGVCKPKTLAMVKTNGKGTRMSASYYFHEVCGGKISRCKPQNIQEPSGRFRRKEIKIVNGAHGKHPRWVLVDYAR